MIDNNGEVMAQEVMAPFLNCDGDGEQLLDISGSTKKFGAEFFTKEGDGMPIF